MSEPIALPVLDDPPRSGVWVDGEAIRSEEHADPTPLDLVDRVDGLEVTS